MNHLRYLTQINIFNVNKYLTCARQLTSSQLVYRTEINRKSDENEQN